MASWGTVWNYAIGRDGQNSSWLEYIILGNWGKSGMGRDGGDLNENGVVDGPDYAEVLSYWDPPPEPAGEPTPEPATLGLLLLGASALLKRRK